MIILSPKDFYQVRLSSLIADYDKDTLTMLYQPLVGHIALSVFFTLWSDAKKQTLTPLSSHEQLLVQMQMATGEFIDARKKLEATGLLRSYLKKGEGVNIYHYDLYAPKTPKGFFNDTLLFGLLIKYIGEKPANQLKQLYNLNINETISNEDEITATFHEIFKPDFEDKVFLKAIGSNKKIKDRATAKIDSEFNYGRFVEKIKISSQINESVFTKKILNEIERLAALYGVDEDITALRVIDCFDPNKPNGDKINFEQLTKMLREDVKYPFLNNKKDNYSDPNLISSETMLAQKINLMETVSPKDYLRIMQNYTQPVNADLFLIDDISKKLNLSNPVINALIDFVLVVQKNTLPRTYTEKVAASLARSNIKTTIDAMEFLNKRFKNTRSSSLKQTVNRVENKQTTDVSASKKTTSKDEPSLEELEIDWDSL